MNHEYIQIDSDPIGQGQERICYVHPDDPTKLVKVLKREDDRQTRRELALYRRLQRKKTDYSRLPRLHGLVQTNLGRGFIVDLIRDYDGSISKQLYWYFERGIPVSEFFVYLEELKQYLLENQIVISVDLGRTNILFQKLSPDQAQLVIIDGLGNHSYINWFDGLRAVTDSKINRRWERVLKKMQMYSDKMLEAYGGPPQKLDVNYRKEG